MTWKPAEFEVATDLGACLRRGEILPPFGVHEDDDGWQMPWVVTHLPTGCMLPCRFVNQDAAKLAVSEIAGFGDWDFDEIDARAAALQAVMTPTIDEWCARGLCERSTDGLKPGDRDVIKHQERFKGGAS
ncbi:MAG TPA: hypothetical protein ENH55_08340 [Aurantimonas coralicida]|uniref:Uncharacterized protein n=2 Tax=root TaxID=1 RepID=A0A9C9TJJ7_9HYPH|nr:hypothetical protein [Aurantimonas coralicida]HEU02928.1 hypothetical protein [Aurantimonas coralicida]